MWTKDKPKKENWYLWRKNVHNGDPMKWHAYFVTIKNGEVQYWVNGEKSDGPRGGWWSSIPCGRPTE